MGHKPQIPEKLSTEGKDFLCHCLESEPKRRWTASMLLDHPFVKVRDAAAVSFHCTSFHSWKPPILKLMSFLLSSLHFPPTPGVYRRRVNGPSAKSFEVYKWTHYCTRYRLETNNQWTWGEKRESVKAHGLKLRNAQQYFTGQLDLQIVGGGAVVSVYVQTGDRYVGGGGCVHSVRLALNLV